MTRSDRDNNAALVADLQVARRRNRGDILRATAEFECPNSGCPVRLVRVGIVEEAGRSKVMQPPCRCPRCAQPMGFLGLVGR